MVGETLFTSEHCNVFLQAWNKVRSKACIRKHYQIYFNGQTISLGTDEQSKVVVFNKTMLVTDFFREYDSIVVYRMLDAQALQFSNISVFNFGQQFVEEHPNNNLLASSGILQRNFAKVSSTFACLKARPLADSLWLLLELLVSP